MQNYKLFDICLILFFQIHLTFSTIFINKLFFFFFINNNLFILQYLYLSMFWSRPLLIVVFYHIDFFLFLEIEINLYYPNPSLQPTF